MDCHLQCNIAYMNDLARLGFVKHLVTNFTYLLLQLQLIRLVYIYNGSAQ
jgi:hypothetical protein